MTIVTEKKDLKTTQRRVGIDHGTSIEDRVIFSFVGSRSDLHRMWIYYNDCIFEFVSLENRKM
jgi:hypothetical protein